jgi:N-acetylmuramoyl-L-alanine amidase
MKFIHLFFCLTLLFSLTAFAQSNKITVVIDAGHGGTDPGHLSKNKNLLPEKDINLLIANKFGAYIDQYLTNVTVLYTRTDDRFVSLDDRVFKANSIKADYFISIHCNANDRGMVHGTESHVNTMSATKSVQLAKIMEQEFSSRAGRHSRGVKDSQDREHSLQVLKYTSMTSVLLECGFLTNEKEAKYLNTTEGQAILASAIFRGFRTFIQGEYPSISFIKTQKMEPVVASTGNNRTDPAATKFSIQIMSSKEPIDTEADNFKKLGEKVIRQKVTSSSAYQYRYLVGSFARKEEGSVILKKVQANGFKDAIIIQTH